MDREAEQEAHDAQKLTESSGNVLGYEAKARVTEEEFASFQEEFEAAISRHGKVCLLLYMPESREWTPAAPEAQKVGNDDLVAIGKLPTRGFPSKGRARDTMQE